MSYVCKVFSIYLHVTGLIYYDLEETHTKPPVIAEEEGDNAIATAAAPLGIKDADKEKLFYNPEPADPVARERRAHIVEVGRLSYKYTNYVPVYLVTPDSCRYR